MIDGAMSALIFVGTLTVLLWLVQEWGHRRYGLARKIYHNDAEAVRDLIRDVDRAQSRVWILCRKCGIDGIDDACKADLVEAVRKARDRNVDIRVVHEDAPSQTLLELKDRGWITLEQRPGVPVYARLIDDAAVQIRDDSTQRPPSRFLMAPRGWWLRSEHAEPSLRAYIERLATPGRPNRATPQVTDILPAR